MSNANIRGNKTLIGLILILIIICSLTAFYAFNTQNQLNTLQSNFNRLSVNYNNLQSKLNNIESSLNSIGNDILLNSSQERLEIVGANIENESNVWVNARALTGIDIVIINAVLRDSSDNIIDETQIPETIIRATGGLRNFEIKFDNANLLTGNAYEITFVTEKGNSFTSLLHISHVTPTPQPYNP